MLPRLGIILATLLCRADEAAAATDKRKQLYALAPALPTARLAHLAAAARPAPMAAAGPLPPFVLEAEAGEIAVARLARAVHAALAAEPPYHAVKLRSTLGKQLFSGGGARGGISSPAALGTLSLADLQVSWSWVAVSAFLMTAGLLGLNQALLHGPSCMGGPGGTCSQAGRLMHPLPLPRSSMLKCLCLSCQELSLGYQKDLQGVYSNGVPLAGVTAMVKRLREVGSGRVDCGSINALPLTSSSAHVARRFFANVMHVPCLSEVDHLKQPVSNPLAAGIRAGGHQAQGDGAPVRAPRLPVPRHHFPPHRVRGCDLCACLGGSWAGSAGLH